MVMTDDKRPERPRRKWRRRWARAVILGASSALVFAIAADGGSSGSSTPPPELSVSLQPGRAGLPIPERFLGLSFELSSAAQLASAGEHGDLVAMLRSLGPGVLRLGGASADTRVAWTDAHTPAPAWASSVLDAQILRGIARLAARSDWRVLLTIGLAHFDMRAAAREAAAAKRILGPWLAGIEVGNEPDSYARHSLRAAGWDHVRYEGQVSAYRSAIARAAPGIALAGPGVSGSQAFQRWGPAEVRRQRPALLTGHHYPLRCDAVPAPTSEQLLSAATRSLEDRSLARYLSVSRASSIRFRMDETNTVSCGGKAGISNSFASALWAVGYIDQTMAAGASGVNLQGNPANCLGYSPLCAPDSALLAKGALRAQPEYYGMLMLRSLAGTRPLATRLVSSQPVNLAVSVLRGSAGGLRVVIADDEAAGESPTVVRVHVGGRYQPATALLLSASSPGALAGVTLGGRSVAPDGSWHGPRTLPRIPVVGGVLSFEIAPSRAVLLTLAPRARTRR